MSRQWKPGDVAVVDGGPFRLMFVGGERWINQYGRDQPVADDRIRPLVVIDPEDREQVERLRDLFDVEVIQQNGDPDPRDVTPPARGNALQAALREFANPAPPRIDEPGLWGVVEATYPGIPRRRWVHHEENRWVNDRGESVAWEALEDPAIIRQGVTP